MLNPRMASHTVFSYFNDDALLLVVQPSCDQITMMPHLLWCSTTCWNQTHIPLYLALVALCASIMFLGHTRLWVWALCIYL